MNHRCDEYSSDSKKLFRDLEYGWYALDMKVWYGENSQRKEYEIPQNEDHSMLFVRCCLVRASAYIFDDATELMIWFVGGNTRGGLGSHIVEWYVWFLVELQILVWQLWLYRIPMPPHCSDESRICSAIWHWTTTRDLVYGNEEVWWASVQPWW